VCVCVCVCVCVYVRACVRVCVTLNTSLLHRAGDSFERIKGQYGATSCYLLQINSCTSPSSSTESLPDPWSQFLRYQRYTVCTVVCLYVLCVVVVCVFVCITVTCYYTGGH